MTHLTPIARISSVPALPGPKLSRKQKAAVVARFLLSEGAELSFVDLPEDLQAALTQQMGAMRVIDRATLAAVIGEFATELEQIGLSFPRGLVDALGQMDGRISPQTAARLRREAGVRQLGDPWVRLRTLPPEAVLDLLEGESTEVAAVVLAKIDTARAAEILGRLPGDRARRLTYAMSQTDAVTPDAVDRIGLSLAAQLEDVPQKAFAETPDRRVGAILNLSPSATRDALLDGLTEDDAAFAEQVRKAIFTFPDIPARIAPADVSRLTRAVDPPVLVMALKYASASAEQGAAAAEFLLANLSKRMADGLRDEMAEGPPVKQKQGEEAQNALIAAIRTLEAAGELTLLVPETSEE